MTKITVDTAKKDDIVLVMYENYHFRIGRVVHVEQGSGSIVLWSEWYGSAESKKNTGCPIYINKAAITDIFLLENIECSK